MITITEKEYVIRSMLFEDLIESGCLWKNRDGEWEYFDIQKGYGLYKELLGE